MDKICKRRFLKIQIFNIKTFNFKKLWESKIVSDLIKSIYGSFKRGYKAYESCYDAISKYKCKRRFKGTGYIFLLKYYKKLIGFCVLLKKGHGIYSIDDIVIYKKYKGRGYGKILVKNVIEYLQSKGAKLIELETHKKVLNFFRKLGFKKKTAKYSTCDRILWIKMYKRIK